MLETKNLEVRNYELEEIKAAELKPFDLYIVEPEERILKWLLQAWDFSLILEATEPAEPGNKILLVNHDRKTLTIERESIILRAKHEYRNHPTPKPKPDRRN